LGANKFIQYFEGALQDLVKVQAGRKLGDDAQQGLGPLVFFSQLGSAQRHSFFQILGEAARFSQQASIFLGQGGKLIYLLASRFLPAR